jgi:hypothetical protein
MVRVRHLSDGQVARSVRIGRGRRRAAMRVSLNIAELAIIRNSLATRHDDLRDLIAEWSAAGYPVDEDNLQRAKEELEIVLDLDSKLR